MRYVANFRPARRGFTLIELLVIISIIAVLVALGAGTYFRVSASQSLKRTETKLKNIQTGLSGQYQAVVDDVKDEAGGRGRGIPTWVLGRTRNDPARARALYLKYRLVQEFPQSFAEALNPAPLQPKSTYYTALSNASSPPADEFSSAAYESAICLYLALSQARRGATFNADNLGAGSVRSKQCGAVSLNYFVDDWGAPITFERWTSDMALVTELSQEPYAPPTGCRDKDDPDGMLYADNGGWSTSEANGYLPQGHPPITVGPKAAVRSNSYNWGFVIRSGGPDSKFFTADDMLGFRLMKEGQRGN